MVYQRESTQDWHIHNVFLWLALQVLERKETLILTKSCFEVQLEQILLIIVTINNNHYSNYDNKKKATASSNK